MEDGDWAHLRQSPRIPLGPSAEIPEGTVKGYKSAKGWGLGGSFFAVFALL